MRDEAAGPKAPRLTVVDGDVLDPQTGEVLE